MIYRSFTHGLEVRDADARTLVGPVVPYDTPTRIGSYTEQFARSAFGPIDTVPLLVAHRHDTLPIGRAVTLDDTVDALVGTFQLSDTRDADEVLTLARDGVPLGLSVGFQPVADEWNRDRSHVVRVRARLGEVSIVAVAAYPDARVTAVRSDQTHPRPLLHLARLL